MFAAEFKTKTAVLEIIFSENSIEEIAIKNPGGGENIKINNNRQILRHGRVELSTPDYGRFSHLNLLLGLLDNYFSGKTVDFKEIPINLSLYSVFTGKILGVLRSVKYGETLSYGELALKAGFGKNYSRACAAALAANKTPVIIPCHRVIYSGGGLGGYSGGSGSIFKAKLLSLECQVQQKSLNCNNQRFS